MKKMFVLPSRQDALMAHLAAAGEQPTHADKLRNALAKAVERQGFTNEELIAARELLKGEQPTRITRGLRALDEVKHCQDKMAPHMRENDKTMRATPPIDWTEAQVTVAEKTAKFVNFTS